MAKPEYIPIPRTGTKCPYSGLSRSGIYNLIGPNKANGDKAVVKSTRVKQRGKTRGRRLVHYKSLMAYLNSNTVPVEVLNLRKAWRKFRAQPRSEAGVDTVDFREVQFLSDAEAEAVENAAPAALHRTSFAGSGTAAP